LENRAARNAMPSAFGSLSNEDVHIIRQSFLHLSKRLYLANEQRTCPLDPLSVRLNFAEGEHNRRRLCPLSEVKRTLGKHRETSDHTKRRRQCSTAPRKSRRV
jgi:hypothetical protein